jgi:hypothetical protein
MSRSGGGVTVGASGKANVGGSGVPVDVAGAVTKDAIVGGVVGLVTGGIPGAIRGAAIPLAVAYMSSSGTRISPTVPDGLEMQDQTDCYVNCFWYTQNFDTAPTKKKYPSREAACTAFGISLAESYPPPRVVTAGPGPTELTCWDQIRNADGMLYTENTAYPALQRAGARPPDSGTWYPATPQQVKDALYKKDPDPNIVNELDAAGVPLAVGEVTVTGPITITGPTVTTTNNIDNSVKTTTTTNNYNYNGAKVTSTGTTTKTETTKADGTKTEDTTTTMNPGDQQPAKPEDPPVQCDKYPNSLGCSEIDTPSIDIPKDTKNITFREESVFSGGSCPANKTMSLRNVGAVTVWDWNQACSYIVQIRALVLALATFAAFLIILPGKEVRT